MKRNEKKHALVALGRPLVETDDDLASLTVHVSSLR
jgi:hypothetical protein